MSRGHQRLADYLAHILEAIERIDRYTDDMNELAFLNDQLVQDAVIRNFEIIGETSNNIEKHYPSSLRQTPNYPWRSPTRCVMPWLTVTSRWTLKSSGRRSIVTFQACTHWFKRRRPRCHAMMKG